MDFWQSFIAAALYVYGSILFLIGLHEACHIVAARALGFEIENIHVSPERIAVKVEADEDKCKAVIFLVAPQMLTLIFYILYVAFSNMLFLGFVLVNILFSIEDFKNLVKVL